MARVPEAAMKTRSRITARVKWYNGQKVMQTTMLSQIVLEPAGSWSGLHAAVWGAGRE